MNKEEVQSIIDEMNGYRICNQNGDNEYILHSIKRIEDDGWRLRARSFSNIVTKALRGKRLPLKNPRTQWGINVSFVKGNDVVTYYIQNVNSKAEALDIEKGHP
jgi:hypothetical protein